MSQPTTITAELSRMFPFVPLKELINVAQFIRSTPKNDIWSVHNNTGLPAAQIAFFLQHREGDIKELKEELDEVNADIDELENRKYSIEREIRNEEKKDKQVSLYELVK